MSFDRRDLKWSGDMAWRIALSCVINGGEPAAPRGMPTLEILHGQLVTVDLSQAVVTSPERKLSRQFMIAEALWIANGQRDLASLQRFAPSYARFSDDGETLSGAYGPKIAGQMTWVVDQLVRDRDTRQAVLTIWERRPPPSKDIPCTVAMSFSIRDDRFHAHAMMRSSDVWMGLPYDMFSFSVVAIRLLCEHNERATRPALPGVLTIGATSSHLYEKDREKALNVLRSPTGGSVDPLPDGVPLLGMRGWSDLEDDLTRQREGGRSRVWKVT